MYEGASVWGGIPPIGSLNSKAANSNSLLAQHVGPAAQILKKFTISEREYFGTKLLPLVRAHARASPKFVHSTFICHPALYELL